MYVPSEKNRSKINLSDEQIDASINTGKPTMIVGPAGCGKSVVLTQRIKNIVEQKEKEYDSNIKILLTTFNRDIIKHLGDWLEQILDETRCRRTYDSYKGKISDHSYFTFNGSPTPNIYILNFDKLPTKFGGFGWLNMTINYQEIEAFHLDTMQKISNEYFDRSGLNKKEHSKILDPNFLIDEYHRIIYGQLCTNEKTYQTKERKGSGNNPTLRYKTPRRQIVWKIIYNYLSWLKNNNLGNFTMQRQRLLRKLRNSGAPILFNHILVDEIQDCTLADYEIFLKMLSDKNNLIIAGDLAQSIHLGSSVHLPIAEFEKKKLKGSFRLPFRISEAIKPLSLMINAKFRKKKADGETEIINPYKGSPPGARPIIVYAKDHNYLAIKIKEIFNSYKIFGLDTISVFERDYELSGALSSLGVGVSPEIILKSKGLEKSCVLWSSRIVVDTKTEIDEFVYTILTRTTSILIVAICENLNPNYAEIIKSFDESRLILWDEESTEEFNKIKRGVLNLEEDDIDNSGDLTEQQIDSESSIEEFF